MYIFQLNIPSLFHFNYRFKDFIEEGMTCGRATIICGDFNFDGRDKNDLTQIMSSRGFKQIVHKSTHIQGGHIDHFYHNLSENKKSVEYIIHHNYYSDHKAICVTIDKA